MLDYENVISNSKAYNIIKMDISENRMSHAYLFVSVDENYANSFLKKI